MPEHGTSHLSVVDSYGNAATLTTTVESSFGSYHLVDGFILNNQLSDFSAEPHATDGSPVANRVEPGKRPRSSMAPTLVFDHSSAGRGALYAVLGSPGGSMIIQFFVKTLVAMLDWGLNPQQAVSWSISAPRTRRTLTSAVRIPRSTLPTMVIMTRWCKACARWGIELILPSNPVGSRRSPAARRVGPAAPTHAAKARSWATMPEPFAGGRPNERGPLRADNFAGPLGLCLRFYRLGAFAR